MKTPARGNMPRPSAGDTGMELENAEQLRLVECHQGIAPWKQWGPYVSERQWGTVREDYSPHGDAWNFFTHDHARSRAYRWGEDGIAGICDDQQTLCFALALWNGKDPILKERLFGLTNGEGNHGEDVKEYYFHLDNTPAHSYMKYLYKYPQAAFPYEELVRVNAGRSRSEFEYELLDTGVFHDDRYFDVFIEYAKAAPDDILIRITAINRGPDAAALHLLPTLWFRNDWSKWIAPANRAAKKPVIQLAKGAKESVAVAARHQRLGAWTLHCEGGPRVLFTENETNHQRLFGTANESPHVKDGINDCIVHGREDAVNPEATGTKASAQYHMNIAAGATKVVKLRITSIKTPDPFGPLFDEVFDNRITEADRFYQLITPPSLTSDEAMVMRQALSGMLWSKQFYFYDVGNWLTEHHSNPLHHGYHASRNSDWHHMLNHGIFSMPDKWEYPWYAAWDLAFHSIPLSLVDPEFARNQMELLLKPQYLHPNGQMPAYEWNFSDVNPPVHAWAAVFLSRQSQLGTGTMDWEFLESIFQKLLLNFTWWVNRKDAAGRNVFEGGFLGLDNIGIFDRSSPLPTGGHLEQADGTAWMAFFSQNMLEMAIQLATHNPAYQDMIVKFARHFLFIAHGMNSHGGSGMWDEVDGFYYDLIQLPDGGAQPLKVRSMVGLLPLCATTIFEKEQRESLPDAFQAVLDLMTHTPGLRDFIHPTGPGHYGVNERGILALVSPGRLRRILSRMLDENEFLSDHGIRALSKAHRGHPFVMHIRGQELRVDYLPAESNTGMFGGNSNWRGPVWLPVNLVLIRALMQFYLYYGNDFQVECPTGSGHMMNLYEVAMEISRRVTNIFLRDENGRRPVYGGTAKFQADPHWRDLVLFYEYFHGDNGAGLGASHQTGWTGLVATLLALQGSLNAEETLRKGKDTAFKIAVKNTPNAPFP